MTDSMPSGDLPSVMPLQVLIGPWSGSRLGNLCLVPETRRNIDMEFRLRTHACGRGYKFVSHEGS